MMTAATSFEVETTTKLPEQEPQYHTRRNWILPLCLSHAAAAWGERSWEFGAGLLLLRLSSSKENELRLTAILVLAECSVCSLLGPSIGTMVDRTSLLKSAMWTLAVQNLGIVAAAGFVMMAFGGWNNNNNNNYTLLVVPAILCSIVARLGSLGSTIATEKRWATALAHYSEQHYDYDRLLNNSASAQINDNTGCCLEEDDDIRPSRSSEEQQEPSQDKQPQQQSHASSDILSRVNAQLRCIDLMCNLCAPIAVGFLMDTTTEVVSALVILLFNLVAYPVEVGCLLFIHRSYQHVLSLQQDGSNEEISVATTSSVLVDSDGAYEDNDDGRRDENSEASCSMTLCQGCRIYQKQPIILSALALAILYLSVVGFGPLMTAWLAASSSLTSSGEEQQQQEQQQHLLSLGHIGLARAVAAMSGLLSTRVTPRWVQVYGIHGAALQFIWLMWGCILCCTVAAFVSSRAHSPTSCLWIVIVSVILSRFGLWGFDLCVTQLLQERVEPPNQIGTVNGVQAALQNAFDALAATSCVLMPDPRSFVWLILGSFGSITIAALLHTYSVFHQHTISTSP